MSWFSGMFRDEEHRSRPKSPTTRTVNSPFHPSEESLQVFDELKRGKEDIGFDSEFQTSKNVRFDASLTKGERKTDMRGVGCLGSCERSVQASISHERKREGRESVLTFKPSRESLKIFDEIKSEVGHGSMRRFGSRNVVNRRQGPRRFDPFQTNRDGTRGGGEHGWSRFGRLATRKRSHLPLDPAAVEWAKQVRVCQQSLRCDRPGEPELYECERTHIPPQLRSHRPSIASGFGTVREWVEKRTPEQRKETRPKSGLEKMKGLFHSVWKVGERVVKRFGGLMQRLGRGLKGVMRSLKSLMSQTLRQDSAPDMIRVRCNVDEKHQSGILKIKLSTRNHI